MSIRPTYRVSHPFLKSFSYFQRKKTWTSSASRKISFWGFYDHFMVCATLDTTWESPWSNGILFDLAFYVSLFDIQLESRIDVYVDDTLMACTTHFGEITLSTLTTFDSEPRTYDNFYFFGSQISTVSTGNLLLSHWKHASRFPLAPGDCSFETFRGLCEMIHGLTRSRPDFSCAINRAAQITSETMEPTKIKGLQRFLSVCRRRINPRHTFMFSSWVLFSTQNVCKWRFCIEGGPLLTTWIPLSPFQQSVSLCYPGLLQQNVKNVCPVNHERREVTFYGRLRWEAFHLQCLRENNEFQSFIMLFHRLKTTVWFCIKGYANDIPYSY